MIDITKDKKGEGFTFTKTQNILGIDFHKQLNISPDEMSTLCEWFAYHFFTTKPCTSLEEVKDRLDAINSVHIAGHVSYTEFNGKILSSDMTREEINDKIFGKLKDRR